MTGAQVRLHSTSLNLDLARYSILKRFGTALVNAHPQVPNTVNTVGDFHAPIASSNEA